MKKNFKYAMMMATALVLGFSSCSSDNDLIDGGSIQEGVKTTARITLTQSISPKTYGPTGITVTPESEEAKINQATVYVFNSTKVLEAEVDLELTAGVASKTFEMTTGSKFFYAAVNIPDSQKPTVSLGDPMKTVLEKIITTTDLSELTETTKGYFMTNVKEASSVNIVQAEKSDVTSGTNNITIQVGRAVFKASVDFQETTVTQSTLGKLTNVQFLIANNPKNIYFQPSYQVEGSKSYLKTPFYHAPTVTKTDYYPDLSSSSLTPLTFKAADGSNTFYGTENSNKTPKVGNASYALLKGTYTPSIVLDKNGANPKPGTIGDTFWRVINSTTKDFVNDKFYFEEPSNATITADGGDQFVKYENGTSYYSFFLANNDMANDPIAKYSIPRNSFWKINITDVSGPGASTPDPDQDSGLNPDPELPIEAKTNIKAEIEVLDWSEYTQDGGI